MPGRNGWLKEVIEQHVPAVQEDRVDEAEDDAPRGRHGRGLTYE